MTATERHAPERAGGDLPADGVECNVDAATSGGLERGIDEVGGAGVDGDVGPELRAEVRLLGRSRERDHRSARRFRQLHRRRTDTTRGRMDQHRLTVADAGAHVQRERGQVERHEDRRGVGQRDRLRHREHHRRRRHRVLGVAPERAARDRDDARPDKLGIDTLAHGLDCAERLHAGDVGRGDRHRRVPAVDAVDVVEVQRDRVGADEHLTRPGGGRVDVDEAEHVARGAVLDCLPCAHRAVIYAAGSSASGRFDRPRTLLEYARCIGWRSS